MVDTKRTFSALKTLYADNSTGAISPQDLRDGVHSWMGVLAVAQKSSADTLTVDDTIIQATASGGAFTLTLPTAASVPVGKFYIIMKIDSSGSAITIDGNGAETINFASSKSISTQFESIFLWNTGTQWLASSWSAV